MDAIGSNIVVTTRTGEVMRILPRLNEVCNFCNFVALSVVDNLMKTIYEVCMYLHNETQHSASL